MAQAGETARMYLETRVVRSNDVVFTCRENGTNRPNGYT